MRRRRAGPGDLIIRFRCSRIGPSASQLSGAGVRGPAVPGGARERRPLRGTFQKFKHRPMELAQPNHPPVTPAGGRGTAAPQAPFPGAPLPTVQDPIGPPSHSWALRVLSGPPARRPRPPVPLPPFPLPLLPPAPCPSSGALAHSPHQSQPPLRAGASTRSPSRASLGRETAADLPPAAATSALPPGAQESPRRRLRRLLAGTPGDSASLEDPRKISPAREQRIARARARRESVSRNLRRTLDFLAPLAAVPRTPFSQGLIAPFRTPHAPPARSGSVREKLPLFDDMEPHNDPAHQPFIAPPHAPALHDVPTVLPDPCDLPPVQYTVQLSTANTKWAGTDKDVHLQLVGDLYTTAFIHLCENAHADMHTSLRYSTPDNFNAATSSSDFPVGSIREFRFKASPVGNLVRIGVRHDTTGDSSAAWKLERVVIRNEELHRSWTFLCSRWLNRDMGNQVELKPNREVSAGRRASRRASRRLSASKHCRASQSAEASVGAEHFATMRDRFGSDDVQATENAVSKGNETGTRRVCFQLQKFTTKSCHVYLLGEIPALGGWQPQGALRMAKQAAADGTWRGEWRLELEIDDDYDEIQYTYMIINESDAKHNRRVDCPDRLRRFKLSAPDSLGRTTEGGRIHIRDSFGSNKFGLPSASPGSPSLILRKSISRTSPLQTPRGETALVSPAIIPTVSAIDPEGEEQENLRRNSGVALDAARAVDTVEPGKFLHGNSAVLEESEKALRQSSEINFRKDIGAPDAGGVFGEAGQQNIGESSGDEASHDENARERHDGDFAAVSPKDDIQRDGEAARREWEEQLNASDGQLFKSAHRLIRRQSEVAYLKQRSSRGPSSSPMMLSPPPDSPEKTSPISSDGIVDDESFEDGRGKNGVIALTHSEIKRPLLEERNRLLDEIEALREKVIRKEDVHRAVAAAHLSLQAELDGLKERMSEQCEVFDAQQAELVRLVMDNNEAYRTSRDELVAERDTFHRRWAKEFKSRRKLFNTIQELRGNIRVFCRVRPLNRAVLESGRLEDCYAVEFPDASVDENARIQLGAKVFEFDHVFDPSASQKAVYDETAGVVASVLDGYNVCVFAYGQTGSGKTHTMNGPDDDRGVNYRALVDLFDIATQRADFSKVAVTVSMMEIYNEQLRDLIREDPNPPKLDIRKDPNSASPTAVHVPNLLEVEVDSVESVWQVLERGSANRSKGKTNMNEHSSRSHLIVRVAVSCEDLSSGVKSCGVLHLVDLAGSERVGRSNVSGDRLKEAQHINKSLATLGDVFMALLSHSSHVPFRNSKLTYLLQDCLGGDSKTLMFVNVSADQADEAETLSSLQFAQRVAKIELGSARKHTEKTADTKAAASLQLKEKELQEVSQKLTGLQRELRKRDDLLRDSNERVHSLETDLKSIKARRQEQNRRENADRGATANEMRELQVLLEKGQSEMRAARQKSKEKDDEISRLNGMLRAKDKRIAEMSKQASKTGERPPAMSSSRLNRPASTPVVPSRKPERMGGPRLPRNASTFTGRSRHVRFESPEAEPSAEANTETEDSVSSRPAPTPSGAARRVGSGSLVRSQTMTTPRPQRQTSRPTAAGKTVTYAFGTRVEAPAPEAETAHKPARNVRLPRAQTQLRPAQRVSQAPSGRTGQPSLPGAGRNGSGLRRGGTIAGAHRTPSGNGPSK